MVFKKIRGIIEDPNFYTQLDTCPGEHIRSENKYEIVLKKNKTIITLKHPQPDDFYVLMVASTDSKGDIERILDIVKYKVNMKELNDEELDTYFLSKK